MRSMTDVEVRFEREDRDGLVPVGTYLSDAARRFGVVFEEPVEEGDEVPGELVEISAGADLLSEPTKTETELFAKHELKGTVRLASHARIEKPGEIVVMTKKKEKVSEEEAKIADEEYRKQFAELPLNQKMSQLMQLEAMALTETLSYVINSPYTIADKLMGVMADFGFKMDQAKRDAAKPKEHKAKGNGAAEEPKEEGKKD